MALQVVQAPTQKVSGVVSAQPTQNITGVVSAPTQTISGVSANPVSGSSNYNPQSTAITPTPNVGGDSVVMPNTAGAGQALQPASNPAGLQTFQFGDGSVYNAQGAKVGQNNPTNYNGQVTQTSTGTPFSAGNVNNTINSSDMGQGTNLPSAMNGNNALADSVFSNLASYLSDIQSSFGDLKNASQVSPEEKAQQGKVASDQAGLSALGYQEQGLYNPNNKPIALPFLQGQARSKMVGAGIQAQLDQTVLNYMQGNRQFAFNSASTLFDATKSNLNTVLDLYTKAAPQNVGTNYNPTTGSLTAIMRNPLTGAQYTANLGNIGAQKQFTSTNIATDPLTGALTFVGTTSDGQVVQQPIGGGSSFGGSVSNPLQGGSSSGNYAQTGNPQVGNVGQLLGNWTSGKAEQLPGAGYQGGVYQKFKELTGMDINASTPTSTLISNIPALSQAIAAGEGYGKGAVGDRINNPGNILWANQANATPYTSTNGYTYAKFDTLQNGWNAMNDLVARKLGATQQPNRQTAQNSVQNLPPGLQQAVKYLPDGTPFFDGSQITAAQIPQAQFFANQTGIKYVNAGDADKLNNIAVTKQNLDQLTTLADKVLFSGSLGHLFGGALNSAASWAQTDPDLASFNAYRDTAINTIQALAGGEGSGLRLNAGEIQTATDNLPKITDSKETATQKLTLIQGFLDKWISQIMPDWKSSSSAPNYTAILNNLMMQ